LPAAGRCAVSLPGGALRANWACGRRKGAVGAERNQTTAIVRGTRALEGWIAYL
jgi:hypothetical protein